MNTDVETVHITADMRRAADTFLAHADGDHQLAHSLAQELRDQMDESAGDAAFWLAYDVCLLCHWRATQAMEQDWRLLEVIDLSERT